MELLKLAAYLDEAHDDPHQAASVLKQHKINYAALRTAWGMQLHLIQDKLISELRQVLLDADVTPVILYSNLGDIESDKLDSIDNGAVERVMQVASYFKINIIRFGIGQTSNQINSVGFKDDSKQIDAWLKRIQSSAIRYSVMPLLEVRRNNLFASQLKDNPKWRIIFDPSNYNVTTSADPFDRYYKQIKSNIAAIELHDFKTGYGHKPIGVGNSRIYDIIKDCESRNYNGWYILKHSLGRKYASYKSKHEVFSMAKQALDNILEI